jgi:hypothetical protein
MGNYVFFNLLLLLLLFSLFVFFFLDTTACFSLFKRDFFCLSVQPLMKRFQTALKKHLTKQEERITLELRELVSRIKVKEWKSCL